MFFGDREIFNTDLESIRMWQNSSDFVYYLVIVSEADGRWLSGHCISGNNVNGWLWLSIASLRDDKCQFARLQAFFILGKQFPTCQVHNLLRSTSGTSRGKLREDLQERSKICQLDLRQQCKHIHPCIQTSLFPHLCQTRRGCKEYRQPSSLRSIYHRKKGQIEQLQRGKV